MTIFSRQAGWSLALVVCGTVLGGMAAGPVAARQAATEATPQAEFDAAFGQVKKLMADLTVLQAQYQQPKADKPALEAKFEETKKVAEAAGGRLEVAAISLLAADPKNDAAREIATAVMAGALETDDPAKLLAIATQLDAAGSLDGDTGMLAASAAIILSQLDEADGWLGKAETAGADKRRVYQLRATV